ncbi:MAG: hypothetical protein ACFE0O_15600 [Opitutales bacterium]
MARPLASLHHSLQMSASVWIHVGVEKTGSTLIERTLRELGDLKARFGIANIDRDAINRHPWYQYLRGFSEEHTLPDPRKWAGLQADFFRDFDAEGACLLSHEFLIGSANRGFYRGAEAVCEHLKGMFAGRQVGLIVYVKRQDLHLESLYKQALQAGGSLPWKSFIHKKMDWRRHDWINLIDRLVSVIGSENLKVKPSELLNEGFQPFMRDFLETVGINWEGPVPEPAFTNLSYSVPGLEIARIGHQWVDEEGRRDLRMFLLKHFTRKDQPKPVFFTPEERREILDFHAPTNAKLFADYMPAYSKFSYANAAV